MTPKTTLVTGVSGYWGALLAERLLAESDVRIIGLDVQPPLTNPIGLDFVQADVRNPALSELLRSESVQTVCHLQFTPTVRPSRSAHDANVIGTAKLLEACVDGGVQKIVFKSSTAVYGALPDNPAFLSEEHSLRGSHRHGTTRDLVKIENLLRDFRRHTPKMILTVLRFANIVGPSADTPMTRFLKHRWAPALLGFDPTMQVIHASDVLEALARAVLQDISGAINVAAGEVMPLSKLMALAGKPPIPIFHPLAYWGTRTLAAAGAKLDRSMPIELDYLRYPWVADLTKMRQEFGFTPAHTAEEILREFANRQPHQSASEMLASDAERLRDIIQHRQSKTRSTNPSKEREA